MKCGSGRILRSAAGCACLSTGKQSYRRASMSVGAFLLAVQCGQKINTLVWWYCNRLNARGAGSDSENNSTDTAVTNTSSSNGSTEQNSDSPMTSDGDAPPQSTDPRIPNPVVRAHVVCFLCTFLCFDLWFFVRCLRFCSFCWFWLFCMFGKERVCMQ